MSEPLAFMSSLPVLGSAPVVPLPKGPTRETVRKCSQSTDTRRLKGWRKAIWDRDKSHCRSCGRTVVKDRGFQNSGECHHVVKRGYLPLRWEPRNGVLVCGKCHKAIEKRVGLKCNRIVLVQTESLWFLCEEDGKRYIDAGKVIEFKRLAA